MTYEPLHHKYRPRTFSDLVGQEAIATTLSNALTSERIAPAYLFTGPRGTGKTSSARILAKSLNCLSSESPTPIPCGKCEVCRAIANGSALDVIEIDAASNTGVDNIREIIERAQFAPVQCRYKVYVIDECLTGDSLVLTETGATRIDNPELLGKRVLSYNEKKRAWEYKKVIRWLDRGIKETIVIKTTNRTIRCTGNHPIRTERGWIQARELKNGDRILSPVNVDAGNLSRDTEAMVASVDSLEAIKTTENLTDRKLTSRPLFWNKLNLSVPFADAGAGKIWKFQPFSNKKAEGSKVSNPIGKGIRIRKVTDYGKKESKIRFPVEIPCLPIASDFSTALYSGTAVSIIRPDRVDGREFAGITAVYNKNGSNTKPAVYPNYRSRYAMYPTRVTESDRSTPVLSAIATLERYTGSLNPKVGEKSFLSIGWNELPRKDWLGGTWTMVRFLSPLAGAVLSNFTRKDTPSSKINLWPLGLPNKATAPKPYPIPDIAPTGFITTLKWERSLQTDGSPISEPIQFPRWITNFEEVTAIASGDVENVYDLEVEENHNFVANGLLVHNCHMLSTAAFNALLKTLEEPPDRVIFVLATTDPQRVLPTIISRCQRFDYRRIPLDAMVGHLEKIARLESIDIELEALTLISQIANGGLRDAESLLDQLSLLAGTITSDRVWELVGAVPERDLLSLLKAIRSDVADAVIEQCRHLMNRGKEPLIVLQNLAGFYLNLLLAKTAPNRPEMAAVTAPTWQELCTEARGWTVEEILQGQKILKDSENQLKNTTQPRLWLEITLLSLLPSARVTSPVVETTRARPATVSPPPTAPVEPKPVAASPPPATVKPEPVAPPEVPPSPPTPIVSGENEDLWQKVIEVLEPATTRSLLRQQGRLLQIEESVARVGISSEQLLKMARPRLVNIEAAFEAVFQRRIKVHLQVGTAIDPSVSSIAREEVPKARQITQDSAGQASEAIARVSPNPPATVGEPAPIERETPAAPVVIETPAPSPVPENGHRKAPIEPRPVLENPPEAAIAPIGEPEEVADEEILKAARGLAKFFEGEIVSVGQKEIESPKAKAENPVTNAPNVRGRPDITEILETLDDEEDIPF